LLSIVSIAKGLGDYKTVVVQKDPDVKDLLQVVMIIAAVHQ
jgi:hypothetical protein